MKEVYDRVVNEVRGMWRFRGWIIGSLWIVSLLGWAAVVALPDMYRATARFQVDTSSALAPLLGEQIVTANVDEQLSMVRQALMGSVQLLKVASQTGLDAGITTDSGRAELLARLTDRLRISALPQGPRNRENLFNIEFEDRDREKAEEVVTVLLDTFIQDTLNSEQQGSEQARRFIEQQIADTEKRLQTAEDRLAAFKRENSDKLPGTEGGYFSRLQQVRESLSSSQRELRIAISKRNRLEQQLSGEIAVISAPDRDDDDLPANSLDARIRDFESQLETLLLDYTEKHPDVIAVRETLARLREERSEELAKLGLEGSDIELAMLDANPVHQALRIALNESEVDIATLQADIADQQATVASLQSLIEEVPEVEAEYARLNRDYEVIREGYQELVESRETQELSRRAYDSGEIDFKVIDPPEATYTPVSPNRLLLFLVVLIVAGGIGGAIAFLLSQIRPVVHDVESLRKVAGVPVLGRISIVTADAKRLTQRADVRRFFGNVVVLGVMLAGLFVMEIAGPGVRETVVGLL